MSLKTWLLFSVLCVFWGIPYSLIKVALVDVSPVCGAWGRITLGALVLMPVAWHRRSLGPLQQHKGAVIAFSVTELVLPFFLIALAESWLSSAMSAILVAAVPLMVVVIAPLFGVRKTLSARRLGGLIVGFVVCTASAMLLYFDVIHAAGAARASFVAYVSPAIAAVLGVGILHEHFGAGTAAGLALILLGSAYGSSGSHNRPAVADA